MDIFFTALGIVLVLAAWPALVLYAMNDSMLRNPRRKVVRDAVARRRGIRAREGRTRPQPRPAGV